MKRCGALLLAVVALTTGLAVFGPARQAAANGGPPAFSMSVGQNHVCTVSAGVAYCWGDGMFGVLGDGSGMDRNVATAVDTSGPLAGKTVVKIAAGAATTCALDSAGASYCWGLNNDGQLGDGTTTNTLAPVAVSTGLAFASITTMRSHSCALTAAGAAHCWGDNVSGGLGDGTTVASLTPVATTMTGIAGGGFSQISAGSFYTCALSIAGTAYCWGDNGNGYLGDGTTTNSSTPVAVDVSGALAGKTLVKISSDWSHTCALDTDGVAYCWGENTSGELGDGTTTDRTSPVAVNITGVLAGKTLVDIDAGFSHTCAIDSTGQAYCWGANGSGGLGNGTTVDSPVPVIVDTSVITTGSAFSSIGAGSLFSCGQKPNGRTYCWGENGTGQLGIGVNVMLTAPATSVLGLPAVPDAPTGVSVVRSGSSATVSWTAPTDPGSSPITGYTAVASPGGAQCTSTGTSCTLTNLSSGTAYTVRVTAMNAVGMSAAGIAVSTGGAGGGDGLADTGTKTVSIVVIGLLALWLGVRLRRLHLE
jgi:alpha-tubulin suppressor-like RCC1 family protein